MDSNTKIIILVLILVFIKFFAHTYDNFANTSPEGEQCTTTIDNIRPAKCEKIDMMGVCQKYSCPIGLKLVDDICLQKNKVCSPSNIDKFANTSR